MNYKELMRRYIGTGRLMQVASVRDGQPWIATVYYVPDAEHNLYWLSFPNRRHSQELAVHPQAAAAIAVKADKPVVGLQIEGEVSEVQDEAVVQRVMADYVQKYGAGQGYYDNFRTGTAQHTLYKLTPRSIVMFNEADFPEDPRKVWDF